MSVQQNHYMIVGAKFGYDEFYEKVCEGGGWSDRDAFEGVEDEYHDSAFEGIHHHNDLCIISDGMSGEYVYVGHVMQKSDNYGGLGDYQNPGKKPQGVTVSKWIKREFGIDAKCVTHVFTHYR